MLRPKGNGLILLQTKWKSVLLLFKNGLATWWWQYRARPNLLRTNVQCYVCEQNCQAGWVKAWTWHVCHSKAQICPCRTEQTGQKCFICLSRAEVLRSLSMLLTYCRVVKAEPSAIRGFHLKWKIKSYNHTESITIKSISTQGTDKLEDDVLVTHVMIPYCFHLPR